MKKFTEFLDRASLFMAAMFGSLAVVGIIKTFFDQYSWDWDFVQYFIWTPLIAAITIRLWKMFFNHI